MTENRTAVTHLTPPPPTQPITENVKTTNTPAAPSSTALPTTPTSRFTRNPPLSSYQALSDNNLVSSTVTLCMYLQCKYHFYSSCLYIHCRLWLIQLSLTNRYMNYHYEVILLHNYTVLVNNHILLECENFIVTTCTVLLVSLPL